MSVPAKMIARVITEWGLRQFFTYSLDVENEASGEQDVAILLRRHVNETGRMAHKIGCANRYKGETKRRRSTRRLLRRARLDCPELLADLFVSIHME